MYRCRTCGAPLRAEPRHYRCPAGHSFDRGRNGYVNLLTGRRRHTGDPDGLVRSRREVLDAGVYAPLRERLVDLATTGSSLDLGCGEGYFTRAISDAVPGWHGAIDTSTLAVRLAAGRDSVTAYAAADAFDIPVGTNSIDTVWSVFGPVIPAEFKRVLRRVAGRVITVSPGPQHLWEIKELALVDPKPHAGRPPRGLRHLGGDIRALRLTYKMHLEPRVAAGVFSMTPYARHTTLPAIDHPLWVTADFIITETSTRS